MIRNRKYALTKWIAAFFAVIVIAGIIFADVKSTKAANAKVMSLNKDGEIQVGAEDIFATVRFGHKGSVKYGKKIRVDAVVANSGEDFSGKLRLSFSRMTSEGYAMVQKDFAVASGESKRVQLVIPPIENEASVSVALCDEDGKVLKSQFVKININNDTEQIYAGLLSDNPSDVNYISNILASDKLSFGSSDEGVVYELAYEDITDNAGMLDSLDVIVINDFDTGKFSKGQIKALKEWISEGGMLFLGSGAQTDKVLKAFSGKLLNGTIGRTKTISTNFGVSKQKLVQLTGRDVLNKKVSLDVTEINIANSEAVLSDGHEKLISMVDYGKGNVLVAEFSLALSDDVKRLYSSVIVDAMKKGLSETKKAELNIGGSTNVIYSGYTNMYGYQSETLLLNETDSLPNLKLYGALLIIYVLLAGPAAYIILKKKDKRNLLWVTVPVLAAVFSITIYLIGTSTRIQKPYINYVSTIELPQKQSEENNTVKTIFSLSNSSNKPYTVEMSGNYDILPKSVEDGYYYSGDPDEKDFDYGVEYGAENTNLIMNKLSAFESVFFEINNKSNSKGTVDINIQKKDEKFTGTLSNNMTCDLEDCILYNEGNMYYIGNFSAGKSFDIGKIPKDYIYKQSDYSYDLENQIGEIFGGHIYDNDTDISVKRRIGMLLMFATKNTDSDTWFYGFTADGEEKSFTDKFSFDEYGATGVYKNADIKETIDGYTVIGSLEQYASEYDSNDTDGYYVFGNSNRKIAVKYKFPNGFKLKEIIYNEETSNGGEYYIHSYGYADSAFMGSAVAEDKKTGKQVTILESAKDKVVKDADRYLDEDGSLTLYYDINYNNLNYEVDSFCLPKVKLAGEYTGTDRK